MEESTITALPLYLDLLLFEHKSMKKYKYFLTILRSELTDYERILNRRWKQSGRGQSTKACPLVFALTPGSSNSSLRIAKVGKLPVHHTRVVMMQYSAKPLLETTTCQSLPVDSTLTSNYLQPR